MQTVTLILGYGIPKDILNDWSYKHYLSFIFNQLYQQSINNPQLEQLIIPSGGYTNFITDKNLNEAEEMIRFLKHHNETIGQPAATKTWHYVPETKSISTLENLLFCRDILNEQANISSATPLQIFCETTRKKRVTTLAQNILTQFKKITVRDIDFDTSANRYLAPEKIREKEDNALKFDLWGLKNKDNLTQHNHIYQQKFEFLRQHKKDAMIITEIADWWQQQLDTII